MFKCKECGEEFDIKPQYCECGNDEFEEIKEVISETKEPEFVQPQPQQTSQKTYNSIQKEQVSTSAILIFILCLIFSILIIFYPVKQREQNLTSKNQTQNTIVSKSLPQINQIWNDSPIKQEKKVVEEEISKPSNEDVETDLKQKSQVQIQPQIIPQQQVIKQTNVQKPMQQSTTPQTKSKSVSKTIQAKQKPQINTPVKTVNKEELIRYKASLRNKIASRIHFAGIIGDGTCIITFSVSQSGELQKHKFKKQSENFSLNDAVYNAIMQTQFYNPPPDGYNGEVMQFTVKIYDGNYEVTLY